MPKSYDEQKDGGKHYHYGNGGVALVRGSYLEWGHLFLFCRKCPNDDWMGYDIKDGGTKE